jgi:hypothetical protein
MHESAHAESSESARAASGTVLLNAASADGGGGSRSGGGGGAEYSAHQGARAESARAAYAHTNTGTVPLKAGRGHPPAYSVFFF